MEPRAIRRVLVVEDDRALREGIVRLVRGFCAQVVEAGSVREAVALLSPPPDLIVADFRLPDGSALTVFEEAARSWPRPMGIVVSGQASAKEAFQLAQRGVRYYLGKPFSLADLFDAIQAAQHEPPDLDPFVAESVGRAGIRQVSERVSRVMLRQALALAGGSRSDAARLLDVSRQAIQQRLRGRSGAARSGGPDSDSTSPRS